MYKEIYFNINELDPFIPSICVYLLQDYEDIFSNEIFSGSPLIRGVEHQIHLVSEAAIPNLSAYRSNPEKTKELQRQVGELKSKEIQGYIRENMSLRVVSVLLVPTKNRN